MLFDLLVPDVNKKVLIYFVSFDDYKLTKREDPGFHVDLFICQFSGHCFVCEIGHKQNFVLSNCVCQNRSPFSSPEQHVPLGRKGFGTRKWSR